MESDANDELLHVKSSMREAGLSRGAFLARVAAGGIPCIKVKTGRRVLLLFRRADVARLRERPGAAEMAA